MQDLSNDDVDDYGIIVDFEQLEDDDREVRYRQRLCLSDLPYISIASSPSSQNGNPERGHDFEQRIAALVADIEKMAPNLKAIEKLVKRSKS